MPIEIQIDWQRAEQLFDALLTSKRLRLSPYDSAEAPQVGENLPKSLKPQTREHALFLFCSCYYMRGGNQSDVALSSLGRLYDENPSLFDPKYLIGEIDSRFSEEHVNYDHLVRLIRQAIDTEPGLHYKAPEISEHWVKNFTKLFRFWDSDPINLFKDVSDHETAYGILMNKKVSRKDREKSPRGFLGFQEKMASMLIYFLRDAGLISKFVFPVPVDFHILRILVGHKILFAEGEEVGGNVFGESLKRAAREVTFEYCKKHDVDPIELGDSMWFLSRSLCRWHPGNTVRKGEYKARKTPLAPVPVTWSETQYRRYQRSCLKCPTDISKTCTFNVPSAHYYSIGQLVPLHVRSKPLTLFPM